MRWPIIRRCRISEVEALRMDVYVPDKALQVLALHLALRTKETEYSGSAVPLHAGWNTWRRPDRELAA
jgi:hypothetical protein